MQGARASAGMVRDDNIRTGGVKSAQLIGKHIPPLISSRIIPAAWKINAPVAS